MSLASGLMCGGRFTCLGEIPSGATVKDVQERAAYAARMAEHYQRLQNTAAARVWSNAAERLRKELLARVGQLKGMDPMDAFDLFDVEDAPAATPGDLFRNSRKGYEFKAGGRRWRVTRDDVGLNQRLVIEAEKRDDEGSSFAEWKDGVLTISPLAKRGQFRPVGRPIVKEQLKGLAGLPSRGSIPMKQVERVMKKLQAKVKRCGVSKAALRQGMAVEREHRDVTKLGIEKTARIALQHLCEQKDYYTRLKKYVER